MAVCAWVGAGERWRCVRGWVEVSGGGVCVRGVSGGGAWVAGGERGGVCVRGMSGGGVWVAGGERGGVCVRGVSDGGVRWLEDSGAACACVG